jgi:hypothetical protein
MIDVKNAVKNAMAYVADIFGQDQLVDVRLEEVERSEDDKYWYITIGFDYPFQRRLGTGVETRVFPYMKDPAKNREFKRIKLDSSTGEVLSMTIRTV